MKGDPELMLATQALNINFPGRASINKWINTGTNCVARGGKLYPFRYRLLNICVEIIQVSP